jgi:hypothetical protein
MCWSQESIIATRTIAEPAAVGPTTSDRRTERRPRGPVADCVPGQLKRRRREPHPPCSGRAGGNSEIINRRCAECRFYDTARTKMHSTFVHSGSHVLL